MSTLIHSVRLVTASTAGEMTDQDDAWVLFERGRVAALGTGDGWPSRGVARVIDGRMDAGPGALLTPGMIDLHGHGAAGASYDDPDADAVLRAVAAHARHGTTRAVLSLATAEAAAMQAAATRIADLVGDETGVLGSHLEGPFLDAAHRGAHAGALLRPPLLDAVAALLRAGRGTVRQITLAPELEGGFDAVRAVVDAGAIAAVGHTGASAEIAARAFDAGARVLTHAFNAMPGLHHRAPGPVAAAAADDRVTLEAIADGVHLDPVVLALLMRMAPGRVALVTDAMAATCAGDGDYRLGVLDVSVEGGVAHVRGTTTIAGSTLTQDRAVRVAVAAGVPLADAVHAATAAPARLLGRGDLGMLQPAAAADAVLWSADLAVRGVWRAGARLS
jgi:N-acetylglucosamine-6-phosphate deacetylase